MHNIYAQLFLQQHMVHYYIAYHSRLSHYIRALDEIITGSTRIG